MNPKYYYGHAWRTKIGETIISGGPYATAEERDEAFAKALDAFGYTPPKWWQYWRWGEVAVSALEGN